MFFLLLCLVLGVFVYMGLQDIQIEQKQTVKILDID